MSQNAFKVYQVRCDEALIKRVVVEMKTCVKTSKIKEAEFLVQDNWLEVKEKSWMSLRFLPDVKRVRGSRLSRGRCLCTADILNEDLGKVGEVWNPLSSDFLCWGITHLILNEWYAEKSS